jgi:hypothetical protein
MKTKRLGTLIVSLLIIQAFLSCGFPAQVNAQTSPDVYVGVYLAYGGVPVAEALIDQVSSYTNLLAVGTMAVTADVVTLNETLQYAYDKGLYFMSLAPAGVSGNASIPEWFEYAQEKWGDHLLGFVVSDEPGGRQLDLAENRPIRITSGSTYTAAAYNFVTSLSYMLNSNRQYALNGTDYPVFTSDYALYWFDYKAGYDAIFAEFGWNYSRQLNVALCRGAATVQNKDWGAIILWTYTEPPYLESGAELYKDLVLAYDNGAKYILIFDSNEDYTQGILGAEHLQALQQFWQYVQNNPRKSNPVSARTAYVLPDGYAYGFRGPQDKIWGLWEADSLSYNLSVSVNSLLQEYGAKLDIIYDDGLQQGNNYGYRALIRWDSYSQPSPSPSPSPTPSLSPTPSQDATPSPEPGPVFSLPTELTLAAVAAIVIVIAATALVLRKRHTPSAIRNQHERLQPTSK